MAGCRLWGGCLLPGKQSTVCSPQMGVVLQSLFPHLASSTETRVSMSRFRPLLGCYLLVSACLQQLGVLGVWCSGSSLRPPPLVYCLE